MTGARNTASSHVAHVVPADVDIEVLDSETLFDASWREGYDWPTVCVGQMLCTACHVIVKEGLGNVTPVVEQQEAAAIRRLARRVYKGDETGLRLACQLRITGDVVVEQKVFNGKMRQDLAVARVNPYMPSSNDGPQLGRCRTIAVPGIRPAVARAGALGHPIAGPGGSSGQARPWPRSATLGTVGPAESLGVSRVRR
jgi:2Fe-2S ferredoxin